MSLEPVSIDSGYERLHEAVLKALSSSNEVKKVVEDLQRKNLIEEMAVINLILSLEELESLMENPKV